MSILKIQSIIQEILRITFKLSSFYKRHSKSIMIRSIIFSSGRNNLLKSQPWNYSEIIMILVEVLNISPSTTPTCQLQLFSQFQSSTAKLKVMTTLVRIICIEQWTKMVQNSNLLKPNHQLWSQMVSNQCSHRWKTQLMFRLDKIANQWRNSTELGNLAGLEIVHGNQFKCLWRETFLQTIFWLVSVRKKRTTLYRLITKSRLIQIYLNRIDHI